VRLGGDWQITIVRRRAHSYGNRLEREAFTLGFDRRSPDGLERYANEELIAELGSVFVAAILGMDYEQRDDDNHAAYLAHWLKALKADPSALEGAENASQQVRGCAASVL
jgi:antirestriction protein ArdC